MVTQCLCFPFSGSSSTCSVRTNCSFSFQGDEHWQCRARCSTHAAPALVPQAVTRQALTRAVTLAEALNIAIFVCLVACRFYLCYSYF